METLQLNDPLRRSGSRRGRTFPDASNIPDPIDARVDDHVATTAGEPPVAAPTTRFTLPVDSLSRASSSRQGSPLQRHQQSFSPPTKSPDSWVGSGPREGQEVAGTREAEADVLSLSELHEQRKSLLSKLPNLRHNHHGDSSKSSSKKSETNGVSNNSYQTVPDLISITSEGPKTESMPNFRVHILDPTISGTTSTTNTTTSGSGRRLEAYRGHKRGNTNPLEQSSAIPVTRSGRTPAAPAERIEALSAVEERPHSSAGTSRNLCSTKSNVADSKCSRLPSFSVRTRNSSADYSPPDYHSVSGIVGVTSPLGLPTPNSTQNLSANGSQSLLNGTGSAQLSSFVEVPHRRTGRNLSDNTTEFGSLRVGSVGALSREDTTASEHRSIRHDSSRKSLKEARAVLRRRGAERSGAPIPPTHSRSTRTVSFTRRGHRGEERQSTNQLANPATGTSTRSGVNPRSCPLDGFHSDEYSGTHSHKGDFVEGIEQVVSEAGDSRGESSFFSRRASDNASLRSASRHDLPSSVTTQRMRSDQSPRQEDPQSPLRSVCVHSSAEFHGPLVELMGSPGDSQELPDEAPAAPPTRGRISSFRRSTTRRNRSSSRAVSITSRGDLAGSDDDSDSEDIRHKSVVDRLALQLAQNSRMYASLAAAPHEADGGRSTFDVPCLANGRDDGDAHPLPNSPTHGGEEAQSTAFGFSTSGWAALGEGETDANDWYAAMRKKQQDSDADEAPGEVEFPNEVAVDASASPAVEGATEAPDTAPVSTNPLEDGSHQLKLAQSSNSRGTNPTVVSVPSSLVKHNSSAVIGTTLDGGCVDSILSAGDKKGELSARHPQPEAHAQRQTTVQLVDPDAPFAVQLASTTMPLESILRENTSTVNRRVTEQTAPEEEEEAALHSPPSQKASPAAVPSPTASQLPPRPIALLLRPEPPKESQIASRAPRRIPGEMLLEPAAANRYASGPEGNSLTAPQTERSDTRHEARPRLNSSPTVTSSSRTPNSGQSPTGADLEVSFATAQQLPTVTPLPGHPRVTSADIMSRGNRASRGAKMSGGSSIQGSSASDKRGSAGSFANSGAGRRGSTHNITSGDSSF